MKLYFAIALLASSACTSVGPHPELYPSGKEIKATQSIDSILIVPTSGTGTIGHTEKIMLSVPGAAYRRYGKAVLLPAGISRTVKTLKMPNQTDVALSIPWQVSFYNWVKKQKNLTLQAPKNLQLQVPASTKKKVTKKNLKAHTKKMARAKSGIKRIVSAAEAAAKKNDMSKLVATVAKTQRASRLLEGLHQHLIDRLGVTYLLVSHFDGDQKRYDAGKPMYLYAGLVNPGTGELRYLAVSEMLKSSAPTTYQGLIDLTAVNMFEDAKGIDELE